MCNAIHIHLTNVNHEVQLYFATSENECVGSCQGTQTMLDIRQVIRRHRRDGLPKKQCWRRLTMWMLTASAALSLVQQRARERIWWSQYLQLRTGNPLTRMRRNQERILTRNVEWQRKEEPVVEQAGESCGTVPRRGVSRISPGQACKAPPGHHPKCMVPYNLGRCGNGHNFGALI